MNAASRLAAALLVAGCAAPDFAPDSARNEPSPAAGAPSSLLESSSPAAGAIVAAPSEIRLVFREPVRLAELLVTGPDGMAMPSMLSPAGAQTRYSVPVDGLQPGLHEVRWRAVASDGAAREGVFPFTVRG